MTNLTRVTGQTNRKMNNGTYNLRREVMTYVYEAKNLLKGKMPRISVRITDSDCPDILGVAYMGGNSIFIPANTSQRADLRTVVFHEILHAVFSVEHVKGCPLMDAIHTPLTQAKAARIFKSYAKG